MTSSGLSKEIVNEFIKRGHFTSEQSVKNLISKIKTDEGLSCSQNAVAQVVAKIKGFSVARRLKKEDKVPPNISEIVAKYARNNRGNNSKPKSAPDFKRKISNSQDPMEKEAYTNASIYPYVFLLENKLRNVIFNKFKSNSNWWTDTKIVKKDIQEYAEKIQKAEQKYKWVDARGEHPIYYVNLEHLFKIIEKNWNEFKNIFNDLGHLRTWIAECIPVRNLIAHNIKTKKPERDDIIKSSRKICTLIEKNKN
ncbi:hypothetical protein HYT56_02165 [Candidatus Woesearchaeota archaeon]|nr:hypothetical protein [Candidatus Woesearchaeota archaeon]